MKLFRKIVTFGDSIAWGDELIGPGQVGAADLTNRDYRQQHCYTGILANHYGVMSENLAFPGGSCQSTRWIYTWWRQHESEPESCLVLIQLSAPWRSSQYDRHRVPNDDDHDWNRFAHSTWIDYYREHNKTAYQYFRAEHELADCKARNDLVQAETYLFFQGQANSPMAMLMFNSLCATLNHDIAPDNLLWSGQDLDWLLPKTGFWAPGGHLNEAGHERLATLLIREIDRVILAE